MVHLARRIDRLLTRERLVVYPVAVLVLFVAQLVWALAHAATKPLPDFVARWTAGRLLLEGRSAHLYDPVTQGAIQEQEVGGTGLSLFVSPPQAAVLFAPLGALPYPVAAGIWAGASLCSLLLALALLRRLAAPGSVMSSRWALLPVVASYPVLELVGGGQDTGFILLLIVGAMYLLRRGVDGWAGALLALGLIKPHLILLVPVVLLVLGRRTALMSFLGSSLLLTGVSLAATGPASFARWAQLVLGGDYAEAIQRGQAWKSGGFPGLMQGLPPADASRWWDLVGLGIGAVIILVTVVVLGRRGGAHPLAVWGLALTATCLASPHVMIYDLVLLAPALFALAESAWDPESRSALAIYFLMLFAVAPVHVLFANNGWPLSVIGAPWHAVVLGYLWVRLLPREMPPRAASRRLSPGAVGA